MNGPIECDLDIWMHKTSFQSWTLFLKASENDFGEKSCKYVPLYINELHPIFFAGGRASFMLFTSTNLFTKVHRNAGSQWKHILYRVRFKEWPPLVLGLVATFLLRLLQFNLMSCLSWNYLSKEAQYISIDQLELKLHIKMCFQSDPNF